MHREIEKQLLQDVEIIIFLKSAILEKANQHKKCMQFVHKYSDKKIMQLLEKPTENDIRLIFQRFETDIEIYSLEKDLSRMCYALMATDRSKKQITDWERAYEYATQTVMIGDIVSLLTGQNKFQRNIKCPLHNDSKASLKVYIKDNRFICFGCGARGSPIDFVMQNKNCSFREAVLFLSNS